MAQNYELPATHSPETEDAITAAQLNQRLHRKQNFPLALFGGLFAALAGAIIWGGITAITQYQIGWMAIGVGFLVGFTVLFLGKGVEPIYGIVGGLFALLGCFLGNYFAILMMVASVENISFFSLLSSIPLMTIGTVMAESFHLMDILFYSLAVYSGYTNAFRKVTSADLLPTVRETAA